MPGRENHPKTPRPPSRPVTRCLWLAGALLVLATGTATADTANDVYFDLPVGMCADGRLVPGLGYYVQRDYATENANISPRCQSSHDCYHAGIDLTWIGNLPTDPDTPGQENAAGDPVFASADGVVVGRNNFDDQGAGVLVQHTTPQGDLYTHYLHLDAAKYLAPVGKPVRRGELVGFIVSWPTGSDNSHAHFEVRPKMKVNHCLSTDTNCSDEGSIEQTCAGNGYSVIHSSQTGNGTKLAEWGFMDPIDVLFDEARRPDDPGLVRAQRGRHSFVPSVYDCDRSTSVEYRKLRHSRGGDPAEEPIVAEQGFDAASRAVDNDSDTTDDDKYNRVWYQVTTSDGPRWVIGYDEVALASNPGSPLCAVEPWQAGRQWEPPTRPPVLDLRFATDDVTDGQVKNWASADHPALRVGSAGTLAPPWPQLDDEFCDQTARLDGGGSFELTPADDVNFRGGVAIEARVLLDALAPGEQVVAAKWEDGGEEWKLAVRDGKIELLVRAQLGVQVRLEHALTEPTCRPAGEYETSCQVPFNDTAPLPKINCDGTCDPASPNPACVLDYGYRQWLHVAARVDFLDRETVELYVDGKLVASAALPESLVDGPAPIRVGDGFRGQLDDVTVWAFPAEEARNLADTVLVIDSSGSMRTNDPNDQRKNAARIYLDVAPQEDWVGVIDFDSRVRRTSVNVLPLEEEASHTTLRSVINSIDSSGGTNIGAGVRSACSMLERSQSTYDTKAMVVLTDGQGAFSPSDRSCLEADGRDRWSIHALGFGGAVQSDLDEIVGDRGTAVKLDSAEEVLCRLQQVRSILNGGEPFPCTWFVIDPELWETILAEVPDGQLLLSFYSAWPGSDVVMTLTSPSGRVIGRDSASPDVIHQVGPTYESYTVLLPEPGEWRVTLYGADVDPNGEPVIVGGASLPIEGGNLPPDVSGAVPSVGELWPPNHKWTEVTVLGVVDPEGQEVTIEVTGITQDEPVTGPDDPHAPDGAGLGTPVAQLRAERDGEGDGRVYEVTFVARDAAGAEATGTVTVCVPHDQGQGTCVDSGQAYDSTQE